jgi:hypothetical protein
MAKQPVPAGEAAGEESQGGALMIDLAGVPDEKEFAVIPKGIYNATVDDVSYGHSGAGNPMWTWKFELSDGDHAGRKLFFHTPFMEVMMPRLKKVLSRIAPELLTQSFNPEKVANDGILVGKACKIRIDIKPYEGKPRNNVRDVLPAGGGDASFLQS